MRGLNIVYYIFIVYFQSVYIDQLTPCRIEAVSWSKKNDRNTKCTIKPLKPIEIKIEIYIQIECLPLNDQTKKNKKKNSSSMEKSHFFPFRFISIHFKRPWKLICITKWPQNASDLSIIPVSIVTCLLSPNTMNKQKMCVFFFCRALRVY